MGFGSYSAKDWTKLKESRGITESSTVSSLFKNKNLQDKYNPRLISFRESRDSDDSPNSTPIIIGFDVTGSMGYLAEEIAKNALNKTVTEIYDKQPVTNPQVMCAAIGDVVDAAPLQVTQFESDIRIVEQVMDLWLEGWGGDLPESYNLLWYFADKHTKTDCYEKRNKKGFLFTIGDATVHNSIAGIDIKRIFGEDAGELKNEDILKNLAQKYEVVHINLGKEAVFDSWNKILPNRVVQLDKEYVKYLADVIVAAMQIISGTDRETVLNGFEEKYIMRKALSTIM